MGQHSVLRINLHLDIPLKVCLTMILRNDFNLKSIFFKKKTLHVW